MAHSIKTVYVVHHSHTDIGYTDLQERVIAIQVNYIKTVLSMICLLYTSPSPRD